MTKIIPRTFALAAGIALLASPFASRPVLAQDHSQMDHEQPAKPAKKLTKPKKKKPAAHDMHAMSHENMPGMDHGSMPGMDHAGGHGGHDMKGFLGPYGMGREGSGTSWQPDTSPHEGIHAQYGEWMTMWHAMFNGVYDNQGGPRGDTKTFVSGMVMAMAQRQVEASTFGFRAMLSPEPFMGASGYPNLLATGETADGRTHLVDRQHPHDLFMELAATYSYQFTKTSSVFLYAGLPGEPALGPSAFMHRTSGLDNPEAPVTHHWLDSTHITFGVLTAGVVLDTVKLEASTFRGREPDQYCYDIEAPQFDSYSARATWNPTSELSMQVSAGHITSPEALVPTVNENRVTASLSYTKPFSDGDLWATTLAWGRKYNSPGNTLDGYLAESELIFKNGITLFARAERVQNGELLERGEVVTGIVTPHPVFTVSKFSTGGIYDFIRTQNIKFGLGALASRYGIPDALKPEYGDPTSYMIFVRLKIQ
jgi:hypothetical protein